MSDVTTTLPRPLSERDVVTCDHDVVGGVPVFKGTRVPAITLFDYLMQPGSLDGFYDEFPTVTEEHVLGVLQSARDHIDQTVFPPRDTATRSE